jgi:uncharacterized protein (DUF305 family)
MLQARDDGLQQFIVILMMVVFGIFNLIANRLKKRGGHAEGEEGVVIFEEEERTLDPADRDRGFEPYQADEAERAAARSAEEVPWWDATAAPPPSPRRAEARGEGPARRVELPHRAPDASPRAERPGPPEPQPRAEPRPRVPESQPRSEPRPRFPETPPRAEPRPRVAIPTAAPRRAEPRAARTPTLAGAITAMPSLTDSEIGARRRGGRGKGAGPVITAIDARRGFVMATVLGRCRGLEPGGGSTTSPLAGLLFLALVGAGCAPAAVPSQAPLPEPSVRRVVLDDPAAIARASADSARLPYTAADIHFMTAMIHHHAQAVKIARWAPTHGASEPVRRLAARILSSQLDEIATMQQWLADRRQPVPEPDPAGMEMDGHRGHRMLMPGMLTDDQMSRLDGARGTEFDRLFLTYMIEHHRGAVAMVEELFSKHGAGQDEAVFRFASDVQVDQITEIERMRRMLADIAFTSTTQP